MSDWARGRSSCALFNFEKIIFTSWVLGNLLLQLRHVTRHEAITTRTETHQNEQQHIYLLGHISAHEFFEKVTKFCHILVIGQIFQQCRVLRIDA